MNKATNLCNQRVVFIAAGMGAFLLFPLFIYSHFYVDWENHYWLTRYYAEYFAAHHRFPAVINTFEVVGINYPQYYGYLYYQLMGLVTWITGNVKVTYIIVSLTLYIIIFMLFFTIFQKVLSERKADEYLKNETISVLLCALVICNTYIHTDLYSRNAMTEYYAIIFLYTAIGAYVLSIFTDDIDRSIFLWLVSALGAVMAVGSHPITAEIGGMLLVFIIIISSPTVIRKCRRSPRVIPIIIADIVLVILAVSPWVYITLSNIDSLNITNNSISLELRGRPFEDSSYLVRLLTFPSDARTLATGLETPTPNLDMQINMPIFFLYFLSLIFTLKNRYIITRMKLEVIGGAIVFLLLLVCTSSNYFLYYTIYAFRNIQFPYRLITYVDLIAILGLIFNLLLLVNSTDEIMSKSFFSIAVIVCATLAIHNNLITWEHAKASANQVVLDETESVHNLPSTFYGLNDYVSNSIQLAGEEEDQYTYLQFEVDADNDTVVPIDEISFPTQTIYTNIQAAEYNKIYIDGMRVEDNLLFQSDEKLVFICYGEGLHSIEYRLELPKMFLRLRRLSYVSILILAVALPLIWVRFVRKPVERTLYSKNCE